MSDKIKYPNGFLYRFWPLYREWSNNRWEAKHANLPPWTPAGKKYHEARIAQEKVLASPPPIHGDARFASAEDIKKNAKKGKALLSERVIGNPYFFFGNGIDVQGDGSDVVGIAISSPPGHALTLAATRSGKGTTLIVPNLISYGGSILIIDPKGENYGLTHRSRRARGRVIRIDPFKLTHGYDPVSLYSGYNPMEFVTSSPEARRLAQALMGEAESSDDKFWHDSGVNLVQSVIEGCIEEGYPFIKSVREILTLSNISPRRDEPSPLHYGLEDLARSIKSKLAINGITSFLGYSEKTRSSILAMINAQMNIWDTPEMEAAVDLTDIPFSQMKDEVITVYIVLPFAQLETFGGFLRLIILQFYQEMTKSLDQPGIPVACIVDEFPALGRVMEIVKALPEIAGYGVRFWLFCQSLSQLKNIYPKEWEIVISQCSATSIFGINDGETARWLNTELGNKTVAYQTSSTNTGGGGHDQYGKPNFTGGEGQAVQFTGVPLISEGEIKEVFGTDSVLQILFLSGMRPILTMRTPFFEDDSIKHEVGSLHVYKNQDESNPAKTLKTWKGIPEGYTYGIVEKLE